MLIRPVEPGAQGADMITQDHTVRTNLPSLCYIYHDASRGQGTLPRCQVSVGRTGSQQKRGQTGHKLLTLCDLEKGISPGQATATQQALCTMLSGLRVLALGSNKYGPALCVTLDR